jgi:diguanylate cyclase (GGDEF)-like protein/putative nucleotidyltransferase with HDIG domain
VRRDASWAGNWLTRALLTLAVLGLVVLALLGTIDDQIAVLYTGRFQGLRSVEAAATALTMLAGSWLLLTAAGGGSRRPSKPDARVEQLEEQTRTDSLTRLGNHRGFHHDLSEAIARRASNGTVLTLMAIDLDGLKQINDAHGHPAGDEHIRKIATCLKQAVAGAGTVYRTGGDEFMVLLPGRRNWHGLALAHQIDHVTRLATGRRAVSIGLTESLGTEGRHLLVHQADVALYEAKRTKLSAVAFHPGLAPSTDTAGFPDGPSHDQRALAAALARAVDAKDSGTRSHSETVAQLCVAIGERLGVAAANLERLRMAGLLHDVGKIGVADAILQKPNALRPEERKAMAEHVNIGHAILISAELPVEAGWVLHHHERYDGKGYPDRLRAGSIPIEARIIAVADAYETMTGARPYRDPISVDEALTELQAKSGTQFDGRCVHALIEVVRDAATELPAEGSAEPVASRGSARPVAA